MAYSMGTVIFVGFRSRNLSQKGTSGLLIFIYVLPNEINTTPSLSFFFQYLGNGDRQVASLKYAQRIPDRKCIEFLSTVDQNTTTLLILLTLLCIFYALG
jgi:hypothetical protein